MESLSFIGKIFYVKGTLEFMNEIAKSSKKARGAIKKNEGSIVVQ